MPRWEIGWEYCSDQHQVTDSPITDIKARANDRDVDIRLVQKDVQKTATPCEGDRFQILLRFGESERIATSDPGKILCLTCRQKRKPSYGRACYGKHPA